MKANNKVRRVKIMLDLEYSACRDMLTGISEYIRKRHCLWQILLHSNPKAATPDDLGTEVDGFIVDDAVATNCRERLRTLDAPTVVTGSPADFPGTLHQRVAFVHNDNHTLGELGAKHLLSLGLPRSFAFVSEPTNPLWCRQRRDGFREVLGANGFQLFEQGSRSLQEFLANLPLPAAILCANDKVGAEVVATCNILKVRIPKDAVVLGIDNDLVLCGITTPPLSSIQINHIRYGMMAADALNRLFSGRSTKNPDETLINRFKIINRRSTTVITPTVNLVDKALKYIKANILSNPSVDSVVDYLGVSRQLVYLRFRETSDKTLARFILNARLNEVAKRLNRSKMPIVKIAKICSFDNLQHLSNAFRRRYGVSMTEYRTKRLNKPD